MPRTQAANYDERRGAIIQCAADLFAGKGYGGSSIADLAEASSLSKSLIYHYFESKDEVLYEVMIGHMKKLLDVIGAVTGETPEARFFDLTSRLLAAYRNAASCQKVLVNDLDKLSLGRRADIVRAEREVIHYLEKLLRDISLVFRDSIVVTRATIMLYFGMINWTHTWFDPDGRLDTPTLARLVADLFLNGALHATRISYDVRGGA